QNVNKRFIILNYMRFIFSILLIQKFKESLHFYINYKKINILTKENLYYLFFINKIIDRFYNIKIFIKINI
ncbi:uncharacterized protein BO80DRAFT_362634, partial [Aspergillus ibericus CBS 121593]